MFAPPGSAGGAVLPDTLPVTRVPRKGGGKEGERKVRKDGYLRGRFSKVESPCTKSRSTPENFYNLLRESMSVGLLGGNGEVKIDPPPATRYKSFLGVEILYRGVQPSNLPLKYSPGGRPVGMAGDSGDGGPKPRMIASSIADSGRRCLRSANGNALIVPQTYTRLGDGGGTENMEQTYPPPSCQRKHC